VALQQRAYALWQLIGIRPGLIRLVVLAQLLLVAIAGAGIGCAATMPALPALFRFFFAGSTGLEGLRPHFGPVAAGSVILFVTVIVVISGWRGAGRASRVPALPSLREPDLPSRRMGVPRRLGALAVLAIVVSVLASLPGTEAARLTTPLMIIAPLVAGLLAAVSPLLFPVFLRAWTALIPASVSASWYLARNSTAQNVSRSTAAVSPLMVAVALAGGFYTADGIGNAAISRASAGATVDVASGTVALLIGGPVLLAVLGGTATIFMSSRSREREFALIQAAGGTEATVLGAAAWEAVIYVVTAVALGGAAVGVTAVAGLWVVGAWEFGAGSVGVIGAAGLLLTLAATVLPTLSALKEQVPRTLAAE
jgi:putative ABC transport system permease protein